jgi:hypothetical protein
MTENVIFFILLVHYQAWSFDVERVDDVQVTRSDNKRAFTAPRERGLRQGSVLVQPCTVPK